MGLATSLMTSWMTMAFRPGTVTSLTTSFSTMTVSPGTGHFLDDFLDDGLFDLDYLRVAGAAGDGGQREDERERGGGYAEFSVLEHDFLLCRADFPVSPFVRWSGGILSEIIYQIGVFCHCRLGWRNVFVITLTLALSLRERGYFPFPSWIPALAGMTDGVGSIWLGLWYKFTC